MVARTNHDGGRNGAVAPSSSSSTLLVILDEHHSAGLTMKSVRNRVSLEDLMRH
jgi:hypothetical protein